MPWYYAGPEAKPVGPISLEELRACRDRGVIKAETYVIEQTGQPIAALAWKKYQDVFPAAATLPPIPLSMALPTATFVPPLSAQPQVISPHPLFPSATPAATPPQTFPAAARPDPYYNAKRTNGWCAWGFGLGLTAFFFSFACGIGLLPALIAILLCIIGLMQVHKQREQAGQGLAIAGLILSAGALLISAIFIVSMAIPMIKAHELTVTEQTSNDSE
jgi:hypothetical protein